MGLLSTLTGSSQDGLALSPSSVLLGIVGTIGVSLTNANEKRLVMY